MRHPRSWVPTFRMGSPSNLSEDSRISAPDLFFVRWPAVDAGQHRILELSTRRVALGQHDAGGLGADETGPAEVAAAQAGTVEPGVGNEVPAIFSLR